MNDTKTSGRITSAFACAAGGLALSNGYGHTVSIICGIAAAIFGFFSDRIAAAEMKWRASRRTPRFK